MMPPIKVRDWYNQDVIFDGKFVIRRDYGRWRKVGLEWLPWAGKLKKEVRLPITQIIDIDFSPPQLTGSGHLHFFATRDVDLDIEFPRSKARDFELFKQAVENAISA
jgi:hypothetical protein